MTLQTAIERAIQGGWQVEETKIIGFEIVKFRYSVILEVLLEENDIENQSRRTVPIDLSSIFIDKNFWEALGKSMGWPDDHFNARCGTWKDEVTMEHCWLCWWKDFFIVFLANGGTIDRFFESLE